jgi:hypothetical protein
MSSRADTRVMPMASRIALLTLFAVAGAVPMDVQG